jgi:hypothetical protein
MIQADLLMNTLGALSNVNLVLLLISWPWSPGISMGVIMGSVWCLSADVVLYLECLFHAIEAAPWPSSGELPNST